ncbi:MAG: SRPBCC domain-containing protein [Acidimicrobiales bacterium]
MPATRDLHIERTFDASIDLIWAMWTEPEHVGEYREVNPRTRLVYTKSIADAGGNPMAAEQMGMPAGTQMETSVVVELEDVGDRTKMSLTHVGIPADSPGGQGWAIGEVRLCPGERHPRPDGAWSAP